MVRDITKNFIRERQFSPKICREGTFRTKKISKKTKIILCKRKGERKQSIQSILKKR